MEAKELESFLAQKARIALNSGYWFGRQGAGYARMTIACPQSMLKEGLSRLEQAVNALPDTEAN
jgi:cystathionine beta-lyase